MQETCVQSLGWGEPLEEGMATHSSIFAWRIPGERNLVGYSPWGHKESNTTEGLSPVLLLFTYLYQLYIKKKFFFERLQNIFSYSLQCFWFCSCFLRFLFLSGKALSEIFPVLCAQSHNHVRLFMVPWTIACQASPSMKFFRQEYWSEWPFLLQGTFST